MIWYGMDLLLNTDRQTCGEIASPWWMMREDRGETGPDIAHSYDTHCLARLFRLRSFESVPIFVFSRLGFVEEGRVGAISERLRQLAGEAGVCLGQPHSGALVQGGGGFEGTVCMYFVICASCSCRRVGCRGLVWVLVAGETKLGEEKGLGGKWPFWTQPPPLPVGAILNVSCSILSPLPLSEVSLPSKIGDVSERNRARSSFDHVKQAGPCKVANLAPRGQII